ncbi:pyridoxamine phosphate oxidase family protein [Rutstroemia sp. NJR-2017a WRK4]|nr:pyridoxamine phosphate oxidase family protein [Rutstroemia sp. NJR-2017a WRK4]
MVQYFDSIPDNLAEWALSQPLFFTASAPTRGKHINVSPKGLPSSTFTVLGPNQCAYIDATGSGIETISHIYENKRVTIMFCSFTSSPRILRFFCTGRVIEWNTPQFPVMLAKMKKTDIDGARAVILLDVWKVQTSCGYAVPIISTSLTSSTKKSLPSPPSTPPQPWTDRNTLGHWASQKVSAKELTTYQRLKNAYSLDSLPGLRAARRERMYNSSVLLKLSEIVHYFRSTVAGEWRGLVLGLLMGMLLGMLGMLWFVWVQEGKGEACGLRERADLMWRLYGKREDPMGLWCVLWGC